ncbi:hypothetical protein F5884DRAFT_778169 [Xylogone sp. PMI_703]|nr:hypothetical protein F5884DRAFT_778169 [Xylogone sp. PMI_703]
MGSGNVPTILSCLLGLLLSILVLIPGCNKGVLDHISIATYRYEGNYSIIYPPGNGHAPRNPVAVAIGSYPDEFHEWFFSVHYLSICAGFMGGTENPYYYGLNCSRRHGGFTFRTDDDFILSYQSIGDLFPVEPYSNGVESFNLQAPFAMFVLGIAFIILSFALLVYQIFTARQSKWLSTLSAVFIGIAANSLLISSSIVTAITIRSSYDRSQYSGWTTNFIGLSWASVAFMYLAFIVKLSYIIMQKEKTRLQHAR